MPSPNDTSKGPKYTFRLADNVWGILSCVQSLDWLVCVMFCSSYHMLIAHAEDIVNSAFELVTRLNKNHFTDIIRYGSFADLTVCITDFSKCSKFQKTSLLAIAMLRDIIPIMLKTPECTWDVPEDPNVLNPGDDPMIKYWFPLLFSFYDIIMNGEDLEVRRLCVCLFYL